MFIIGASRCASHWSGSIIMHRQRDVLYSLPLCCQWIVKALIGLFGLKTSAISHSEPPGGGVRPMPKSKPSGKGAESIPKLYWLLGEGNPSPQMSACLSDEMSASTPTSCWVSRTGSTSIPDSSQPSSDERESTPCLYLVCFEAKLKPSSLSGVEGASPLRLPFATGCSPWLLSCQEL